MVSASRKRGENESGVVAHRDMGWQILQAIGHVVTFLGWVFVGALALLYVVILVKFLERLFPELFSTLFGETKGTCRYPEETAAEDAPRPRRTRYPVLFSYRDLVEGRGFVAGVGTSGRALLDKDDDGEVTVNGVSPGGLGGIGGSRREAMADFRDGYRTVLYDLAAEARDFEEFRSHVEPSSPRSPTWRSGWRR